MSKSCWDPKQYEKFKDERLGPFLDLLALVEPRPGMRVVDLGCGTGENTHTLHERLQAGDTLGLDNSESMLAKSAGFATTGLSFRQQGIEDFAAEDFADEGAWDLVFSNAALHFVEDHPVLFRRLFAALRVGGQLAVHLPANHVYHTHVVAAELAGEEPFASALGGQVFRSAVLEPERYAELLYEVGFAEQQVRLQVYHHLLPEPRSVVEWVKGSLLTWYEKRMPAELYPQFLAEYERRLLARIADTRPFFFTFRRVLLWARR